MMRFGFAPTSRWGLYVLFSLFAALLIACGGTDGSGSSSSSSSVDDDEGTGAGNTGGSGAGTSTSSGGSDMCYPTQENNWCMDAPECECLPTPTSTEEFCSVGDQMGIELCTPGGNVCEPGHNRCGYHLGMGVDYQMPECLDSVNGDNWHDGNNFWGKFNYQYDANEQAVLGTESIAASPEPYFAGFVITGNKVVWNMTNRATASFAQGEFSPDCTEVTIRYYDAGAPDQSPYTEETFYWSP